MCFHTPHEPIPQVLPSKVSQQCGHLQFGTAQNGSKPFLAELQGSTWLFRALFFSYKLLCSKVQVNLFDPSAPPCCYRRWQSLTMGISLAATGLLGGVVQPSTPAGGREGTDNDQVQLQKHEKVSQEEAKELKQV